MPESFKDIMNSLVPIRTVLLVISFAVSATFSLTKIYARFELIEKEQALQKKSVESEITGLNARISKITDRNLKRIETLEKK